MVLKTKCIFIKYEVLNNSKFDLYFLNTAYI